MNITQQTPQQVKNDEVAKITQLTIQQQSEEQYIERSERNSKAQIQQMQQVQ